MLNDAVRNHYVHAWGEPSRRAAYHHGGREIEVYKWNEQATSEGVNIYATVGASEKPIGPASPDHRIEFFLGLKPAADDVARPLAMIALDPNFSKQELGHGHTVTFSESLWGSTEMRSFLLLRPIVQIVPPLEQVDGLHLEFIQAIPVYSSEIAFKARSGIDALLGRWRANRVKFWDPHRAAQPEANSEGG